MFKNCLTFFIYVAVNVIVTMFIFVSTIGFYGSLELSKVLSTFYGSLEPVLHRIDLGSFT